MSVSSSGNLLSPFDLAGIGMGFGLYRPRRPSYTFATRCRQRSESYRYATRKEHADSTSEVNSGEDFIEGVLRNKARKIGYLKAAERQDEISFPTVGVVVCDHDVTPARIDLDNGLGMQLSPFTKLSCPADDQETIRLNVCDKSSPEDVSCPSQLFINNQDNPNSRSCSNHKFSSQRNATPNIRSSPDCRRPPVMTGSTYVSENYAPHSDPQELSHRTSKSVSFSFNKNLVVLCVSFILVFSPYRAIQNLQSSLHATDHLGIIAMMVVHVSMVIACLVSPIIINIFKAKWALCIAILCFLIWFGGNFHPTFYTLVPTALFVGLGQGILWTAQSSYILKLASDSARVTKRHLDQVMFRFHGIFLACFQTTHIWGNLISSLLLSQREGDISATSTISSHTGLEHVPSDDLASFTNESFKVEDVDGAALMTVSHCGALHRCQDPLVPLFPVVFKGGNALSPVLWKLMTSYIMLGVVSFGLIVIFLERLGARADPDKTPREIITQHLRQLSTHRTLKLLVPLLLFNGMQQGFIYSDYNQYFVTCTLGVHYVGYCMITLGVSNVLGAVFVAAFSNKIPREVVLGFGGIFHIALMIGYLIWIPENKPLLFLILAAAWGLCDSVWQTQCKTLICLTCLEAPEIAFTNYRLVQSLGLAFIFGCGTFMCVSAKLYLLMTLLVVAIMFYVLAEYRLRHHEDEVFEEP